MKDSLKEMVNKPNHYTSTFSVECKDLNIYLNSYLANVCKYLYRWDKKGTPEQDLLKATEYLRFYFENFEYIPTINLTTVQWKDLQDKLDTITDEANNNGEQEEDRVSAIYALFVIAEIDKAILSNPTFSFVYEVGVYDLDSLLEGRNDLIHEVVGYIDSCLESIRTEDKQIQKRKEKR